MLAVSKWVWLTISHQRDFADAANLSSPPTQSAFSPSALGEFLILQVRVHVSPFLQTPSPNSTKCFALAITGHRFNVRALLTCHCPHLCTLREHSADNNSALFILRSLAPKDSRFVVVISKLFMNEGMNEWMNAICHFRYAYFSLIYSDWKVPPKSHSPLLLLRTQTQILNWEHYHSFLNLPCPEVCPWN